MKLYRVGRKIDNGGMWYNPDGTENRVVDKLTNKRLAELPMGYDPMYRQDGKVWQCAAWDIEHLYHWFNLQDMLELIDMGYEAVEFDCEEYIIDENQVRFTMTSITNLRVITDGGCTLPSDVGTCDIKILGLWVYLLLHIWIVFSLPLSPKLFGLSAYLLLSF